MSIRIIMSDVDGCLTPEESVPFDLESFQQFASLCRDIAAGVSPLPPLTLCTGRPQPYVEVLLKLLDIRLPAICESGAVIYTLSDNHARYAPAVTHEKVAGLRALRCFIEDEVLPRHAGTLLQFGKEAQLSIFSKEPAIFPAVRGQLDEFLASRRDICVEITNSHFYVNIGLTGVDKGSAIRHVLGELKISRDEAAGIGDTEGDLAIRENVGFFACPANATGEIRRVADYVSPYPAMRGVLDILGRPEFRPISGPGAQR
jgi:HAD superfamily hydrolase (TIGR01484 family)